MQAPTSIVIAGAAWELESLAAEPRPPEPGETYSLELHLPPPRMHQVAGGIVSDVHPPPAEGSTLFVYGRLGQGGCKVTDEDDMVYSDNAPPPELDPSEPIDQHERG